MTADDWPSLSRVSKAGSRIRRVLRDPQIVADEEALQRYLDDCEIVFRHRDSHVRAMASASGSVRYHCTQLALAGQAKVTQRLKRFPTILEKLERERTLSLDRMHDLGGVRAVVPTIEDVRALQERLLKNHPQAKVADYVTTPRQSGYRAVHIITGWSKAPRRMVEIQLRSLTMHRWADMVETVSLAVGVNHKQDGDTEFHRWARALSAIMEAREVDQDVSRELAVEYDVAYTNFFGAEIGGDDE